MKILENPPSTFEKFSEENGFASKIELVELYFKNYNKVPYDNFNVDKKKIKRFIKSK